MTLVQETSLFSNRTRLCIEIDEKTGIVPNSPYESLILSLQGTKSESLKHVETQEAHRVLNKIRSRLDKIKSKLENGEESASDYLLDEPSRPDKIYGEIVLTWLLVRGLILKKLHRIWEAVVMFKLIDFLKDIAPRSKFVAFAALTELAEIVLDFDVCEEPLIVSSILQ